MVSKEELRELMSDYLMLRDDFDIKKDFGRHTKKSFVENLINLTTDLEASDLNTQAFDKVNSETSDRENLLSTQYYFDFRDALIDIVMNRVEQDMTDILAEYQKVWHHV
jgi:hypothetical protein